MVFSRKKETAEIDGELIAEISRLNIRQAPEYIAAVENNKKLKADLAATEEELRNLYNAYSPPGKAMSREDDAVKLLAGEPLQGESRDTLRQNLQRKIAGLRGAVDMSLQEIIKVELRLALEICEKLSPAMIEMESETLEIFDELEERLEKMDVLYQAFSRAGMGEDRREGHWRLTPFEMQLLHGGSFPTLRWFIDQRRESWGLKAK